MARHNNSGSVPMIEQNNNSCTIVNNYLYIIGGNDHNAHTFNDCWRIKLDDLVQLAKDAYNLLEEPSVSLSWECLNTNLADAGGPVACIGHTATKIGNSIVIYGGRDVNTKTFQPGAFKYDTTTNTWSEFQIRATGRPFNRTGHCDIPTSTGVLYMGGLSETNEPSGDIAYCNFFGAYRVNQYKNDVVVKEHALTLDLV